MIKGQRRALFYRLLLFLFNRERQKSAVGFVVAHKTSRYGALIKDPSTDYLPQHRGRVLKIISSPIHDTTCKNSCQLITKLSRPSNVYCLWLNMLNIENCCILGSYFRFIVRIADTILFNQVLQHVNVLCVVQGKRTCISSVFHLLKQLAFHELLRFLLQ